MIDVSILYWDYHSLRSSRVNNNSVVRSEKIAGYHRRLLEKKPFKRSEYPVSRRMWKHILIQSIFQLALMLILYLVGPDFLVEDDPSRIAQGDLFKLFFGVFP